MTLLCPAPRVRALSDDARLMSDVCQSVAYIGPKSRTERPHRKTKIGTEVGHVTRDSDTTFKVKRSKVNLQGAGAYCGGLPHSLFNRSQYLLVTLRIVSEIQPLYYRSRKFRTFITGRPTIVSIPRP